MLTRKTQEHYYTCTTIRLRCFAFGRRRCIMSLMHRGKTLLLYLFLTLAAIIIGGTMGFMIFSGWDLPDVKMLEEYRPNITSRLYSDSNRLLAEFFLENRTPVALDDVPETMIKALIATEAVAEGSPELTGLRKDVESACPKSGK